jgi:hypothetical protein
LALPNVDQQEITLPTATPAPGTVTTLRESVRDQAIRGPWLECGPPHAVAEGVVQSSVSTASTVSAGVVDRRTAARRPRPILPGEAPVVNPSRCCPGNDRPGGDLPDVIVAQWTVAPIWNGSCDGFRPLDE